MSESEENKFVRLHKPGRSEWASQKGVKRKRTYPTGKAGNPRIALIDLLWEKMAEDDITPSDAADRLGISYPYLMLLRRGERKTEEISMRTIRQMAEFLDLPALVVAQLAGIVVPLDFYYRPTLQSQIEMAYSELRSDPKFGGFAPERQDWDSLTDNMKLLVAVLFQNGRKTAILDPVEILKWELPDGRDFDLEPGDE